MSELRLRLIPWSRFRLNYTDYVNSIFARAIFGEVAQKDTDYLSLGISCTVAINIVISLLVYVDNNLAIFGASPDF